MTFKVSFDTEMPFLLSSLSQMSSLLYFSLKPWRENLQDHIMDAEFGVKPLCIRFFVMEFLREEKEYPLCSGQEFGFIFLEGKFASKN